ncbi:hypothetical protein M9H77_32408 [Catharanthus roseus]|uniref:Uncharacterized protein n=1 Tax=Catharanthus roseus TaxID=4058 RepID=A0ACC0A3R6_CATRO|nr:hypothetical protein M9H77_32408 [Catharanthus roseus]
MKCGFTSRIQVHNTLLLWIRHLDTIVLIHLYLCSPEIESSWVYFYKSGCCVMQCCVENAQGETREYLINEIITNAMHLAEDPYGNYVVQHLLSQKIPGVTEQLLGHLRYRFTGMSTNKYASNVVEKFLTEAGEEHSTIIIMELINSPDAAGLLFDPFANYVIQRALSVSRTLKTQSYLHSIISISSSDDYRLLVTLLIALPFLLSLTHVVATFRRSSRVSRTSNSVT